MSTSIRYADQNTTEIDKGALPLELPIIPLRNAVILPSVLLPIFVGRNESVELIEKQGQPGQLIALFTQVSAQEEKIDAKNLYRTGTLAEIHRVIPMGEGGYQVFLQGVQKIELIDIVSTSPYLVGRVMPLGEINDVSDEQFLEFQAHVVRYVEAHPGIPDEVTSFVKRLKNPSALANQVVFFSGKEISEKVDFLKISSVSDKLKTVQSDLIEETNRMQMEREVRDKVEKDTSKMQRDFYLRKQLETIRKELGEDDENETDDLESQLKAKWLPDEIRKAVDKELKRYRRAQEGAQGGGFEINQIRNWLELVLELPFENPSPGEIHLGRASQVLDEDHEGLEEVKKRILEYLAVEKQTGGARAPILCLVGPPGVGKTSLAKSVARALNRPLVRSALGGVRDEAEIRGHRRTYVGAMPGKILTAMKKAERRDPVFLLDEIDKTGASYNGDPSAALLEVLDPEQNNTFEDHYLGLPYDLSRVLFIATANSADSIPLPLLDRMELVNLSGYTLAEKTQIAKKHLVPGILSELKLDKDQIQFSDKAIERTITAHTREAGVRSLKRRLESIARKSVRKILEAKEQAVADSGEGVQAKIVIQDSDIKDLLGRDRFHRDSKEELEKPGLAVGLAWTPVGGDILYIEATSYPGKGDFKLSGQLGDVMKESAHAAFSFLKGHARELGISSEAFASQDFHIHIPGGAIPKDGPSAGVTLLTALTSLLKRKPVTENVAMTGEISLRGKILPVGGIKEKVLAARAAGIGTVLLPEQNQAEYEEIPAHVTEGLKVEYYSDMMSLLKRTVPASAGSNGAHSVQTSAREHW
ncbi:MAG: endopeptidase La [Spirochaetia bacterium]|nr:endopeptidase La [Spirochaetia bacterium]